MIACIFHGDCFDGFGAAWVVRRAVPEVIFIKGKYGEPPPGLTDMDVVMVDFSYPRQEMERIAEQCRSLVVLDHHKTAAAALHDLGGPAQVVFDMNRSGALIAWDWYFPREPAPNLIEYISDRDLWKFELPHSREVHSGLASYPLEFEVWDELMATSIVALVDIGQHIERKQRQDLKMLLPITTRRMVIDGYTVPVANLPITYCSDAGNMLCSGEPFAATYYDGPDGRYFSLRSTNDGVDVSQVALKYGGGGHRNASGFKAPRNWEGE